MSIRIERVTELPTTELVPLVAESESEGWRILQRLLDEWSSGENRFDRPGEALLVAREAGRLVGVCGLNIDPYADTWRVGRVRRMYVSSGYRRRGIGRQLIEQVILMSRRTFNRLHLRTTSEGGARFYEALGFRPTLEVAECTHALELSDHSNER